jgi:hypothetical protein
MALEIYVNTEITDLPLGVGTFTLIDVDNDFLLFSNGSDVVADGEVIPSETQLNSAGILLTGVEQIVPHYFLADNSANLLKEIHLMGASNSQHVMAFSFDNPTATEPVLEIWDDEDLNSIESVSLGEGVASSSWFRGICTTDALPGVGWNGSRLAGSNAGNFLWLNNQNGPLSGADVLYFQLKIVIPSIQVLAGAEVPVFAIKYASV